MAIKVLVADDHPIVRSGIINELIKYDDIEVIGEATNGDDTYRLTTTLNPDLVLLDMNMPGLKTVTLIRLLQEQVNPPHVLILTAYSDTEYVIGMLKAGARGYILKDENPAVIVEGIRAVVLGRVWLSASVMTNVIEFSQEKPMPADETLSSREVEVLKLMAQGYTNNQIARSLILAEGTIKNYVCSIYIKLKVSTRSEAVAWAWQNKILISQNFK